MEVSIVPKHRFLFIWFSFMLMLINTSGCNWRKTTELTPETVAAVEKWIENVVIPRYDDRAHPVTAVMHIHNTGAQRMAKLVDELLAELGKHRFSVDSEATYSLNVLTTEEISRRSEQDEKFQAAMKYLSDSIYSMYEPSGITASLLGSIATYRPFWKEDAFQQSEWDLRIARIQHVPPSAIVQWQQPLANAKRNPIGQLEVVLHLIDIEGLFTKNGFDAGQSEILVGRLERLREDNTFALAQAINVNPAWSAVLITQNDAFFADDKFRQGVFDDAMARIRAKLTPPKK
jgi:hypothetical protein